MSHTKSISVRDLKAHWSDVERQIADGEELEVLNRGRPTARIIPPTPRPVVIWDDHLATALDSSGRSAEDTVSADREGRW